MKKVPCLKFSQMHEGCSTLINHWPGLPYVPSRCPRPWKEAVRGALCLLVSKESTLRIGSRHPTFTEDGRRGQVCGQDSWRQTWVFSFGWPGLRQLPSYTPLYKPLHSPSKFRTGKPDGGQCQTQNQQLHVDSHPIPQVSPQHDHLLKTPVPDQDPATVTIRQKAS